MTVTSARGFEAAGVACGIKSSGARDVAIVRNVGPIDVAAGVFTSNRFQAAPVLWSRQVLSDGRLRAVVLNSGGANACTGPAGFADTHVTAEATGEHLGVGAGEVAVCSTGLIGVRLPMERLLAGVAEACGALSSQGGPDAARAIMTTDSVPKTTTIDARSFVVGGMAKGAGMLAPSLATMLVVLTTDAVVSREFANEALRTATAQTFDRIDSDGCMSTNDTVLLMASGSSGFAPDLEAFTGALTQACAALAAQLIADAEGSSKDIVIVVRNARSDSDALDVARAIARSNLLKCAIHGEDPNWGRVLAAAGTTSAEFEPDDVDVAMNGVWVCRGGSVGEDRERVDLSARRVVIEVDLHAGPCVVEVLTNDLTAAYVHENSAYAT